MNAHKMTSMHTEKALLGKIIIYMQLIFPRLGKLRPQICMGTYKRIRSM